MLLTANAVVDKAGMVSNVDDFLIYNIIIYMFYSLLYFVQLYAINVYEMEF